ncbi:MAG: pyrroline-5-carboxylate reductase [Lachnospiraceae bacterium]|nr:pyrroline-5-carboxylate reductase [Lachnospiraceae bacterium]
MGFAIMKGLLKKFEAEQVTFYEKNIQRAGDVAAATGVVLAADSLACASSSEYVILAVKPQHLRQAVAEIAGGISAGQILISIAPGISVADLKGMLGTGCRVVRAMPNTPALVGEGMTGVCYDPALFSGEEQHTIRRFFESFGKMAFVEEKLIDAVVCVSGSSPAYVYMFMEALADSGVKYGLPRDMAYEMAAQAVLGSARMLLETGEHPGRLKDQVCSPGGTTIAAVAALEEHGLRSAVMKACDACYAKCGNIH